MPQQHFASTRREWLAATLGIPSVVAAGRPNVLFVLADDLGWSNLGSWPGVTPRGAICAEPVCSTDLYKTTLEMAGLTGESGVDSWSLLEDLENGQLELFDLSAGLGETRNLSAGQPERARSLRRQLDEWREAVRAPMPQVNQSLAANTTP